MQILCRRVPWQVVALILGAGLFLDSPTRQGVELNGTDHIWDLTRYLFENPNLAFIVFREYNCGGDPSSRPLHDRYRRTISESDESNKILPERESIQIVSGALRSALHTVGECNPFDCSNDGEMESPYIFIYHHRSQLRHLGEQSQGDLSLHVSALLSYIEDQNQIEYDDADEKLSRGVVTREHLPKLFMPNRVFLTRTRGQFLATVLGDWPKRSVFERDEGKHLILMGWVWGYNGESLVRQPHMKEVTLASHDEVPVDQLSAFPLEYASVDLKSRLTARGRKFWGLRFQHLMAYTGADFLQETLYVCLAIEVNYHCSRQLTVFTGSE